MSQLLPEINIGMIGHVDHGKTTLVSAISGKWTSVHSEEIKRGITIKLGYADATIYLCEKCKKYTNSKKCSCGGVAKAERVVSFVDAPGHETLMAIMVSGAAIMDAAILMIAANEPCPQPQTREHLVALKALGIKQIIVVQNKIDLVTKEQALANYEQVKKFVTDKLGFEVPIIPVAASKLVNIDYLLEAIQEFFVTPKRDDKKEPIMLTVRSFDVNKPGCNVDELKGGVVGGSIIEGVFEVGKQIEITPGIKVVEKNQNVWKPIVTTIRSIVAGSTFVDKRGPGGLVALSTDLDPAVAKGDSLTGNIVAYKGKSWPARMELKLKVSLFDEVLGLKETTKVEVIHKGEPLMISVGTTTSLGTVSKSGSTYELRLKKPICARNGAKVALSRNFGGRWRLIGFGEII